MSRKGKGKTANGLCEGGYENGEISNQNGYYDEEGLEYDRVRRTFEVRVQ